MSKGTRQKPSGDRLVELANQIIDPNVEPGPLDREDIREALCELIQLRQKPAMPRDVPTLKAADVLTEVAGV